MKFTPLNIKNQEFNKSVRGFDRDEVKAFLEKISDEFAKLQSENDKYNQELEDLREQNKEFKKIEKNLQDTLLNAHESSNKAVDSAKKQTALLYKEAELKSAQIIEKAKEDASAIRESVLKLREEKNLLIARLKAMIESQANLLEVAFEYGVDFKKEIKPQRRTPKSINTDDILEKLL
ncbi:MAG: DivIVA domain-containing protein [bacterium]